MSDPVNIADMTPEQQKVYKVLHQLNANNEPVTVRLLARKSGMNQDDVKDVLQTFKDEGIIDLE